MNDNSREREEEEWQKQGKRKNLLHIEEDNLSLVLFPEGGSASFKLIKFALLALQAATVRLSGVKHHQTLPEDIW